MKTRLVFLAALSALAGCMGAAPKAQKNWVLEWKAPATAARVARPFLPAARLQRLEVRPPYNDTRLAVLRADGSVAFDPCNGFAAQPASLLRGAALDALEASGTFEYMVPAGSSSAAPASVEAVVTRLALDCRDKGRRDASVAVTLALVEGRAVVSTAAGESSVPVKGGDYSAAFSKAFSQAMTAAVRGLDAK